MLLLTSYGGSCIPVHCVAQLHQAVTTSHAVAYIDYTIEDKGSTICECTLISLLAVFAWLVTCRLVLQYYRCVSVCVCSCAMLFGYGVIS